MATNEIKADDANNQQTGYAPPQIVACKCNTSGNGFCLMHDCHLCPHCGRRQAYAWRHCAICNKYRSEYPNVGINDSGRMVTDQPKNT